MNRTERLILLVLASVNFTHIVDFMIMMPLGPQLMELLHMSPQQFGFAVSAYALTAGVSGFAVAFVADQFDRKKILLFAYIGFVIGTFSCALATSFEWLVAARVLAGFFGGMIGAQVLSIVADVFPYERRGTAMGFLMTAFSLASVMGVPLGLKLASWQTWHTPFVAVGIIGMVVIVMIMAWVPPITKHLAASDAPKQSPMHVLTDIMASPVQLKALSLSVVLMMGHFMIIPYIAPALVANAGYDKSNLFLIYMVGGLLTIVTSPWVGKLADQRGKFPVFVLFALLSVIPMLLITHIIPIPLWATLAIAGLFFITVNGRMVPVQALVSGVVDAKHRGGFMSINSSAQQLATGIAANISGAIIIETESGRIERYNWVGYLSAALLLISIGLAWRVQRAVVRAVE
jgi:MFS transporter, DHA1 family, inner membrane transport protein